MIILIYNFSYFWIDYFWCIMQYIVFDIETSPLPFDSFSESQQEYLLRYAKDDEEVERKKAEMGLSPLTAQVVCIGMARISWDNSSGKYKSESKIVLCSSPTDEETIQSDEMNLFEKSKGRKYKVYKQENTNYYLSDEKWVINEFWSKLAKYPDATLISFNGRNFDAPFLMLRSALLGVRPSRNLMEGTRFNYSRHVDLLDELTFYNGSSYGATRRFNFDFYARAFGLTSPKAEGIDGSKVSEYFHSGKIYSIAKYCMRDVAATFELFKIWNKYLNFGKNG